MTSRLLWLTLRKKLLFAAAGMLTASGLLNTRSVPKAQSEAPLAFEVASVKQDKRDAWVRGLLGSGIQCPPPLHCGLSGNKFDDEAASLMDLIIHAYSVKRFQIAGLPSWGDSGHDVYDIAAKVEGDGTPTLDQVRRMLQTLLADRFQLKLHHETKEVPVYALVVAKSGSKLTSMQDACTNSVFAGGPRARGGESVADGDVVDEEAKVL